MLIIAVFPIDLLMPIPVKPKKPIKPKAEPGRQSAANPLRQADQRWQRAVRFGWDKGGSRGGRN